MDFAKVLALVSGYFDEIDQPYAVIGAVGLASLGVSRTTFDIDIVAPSRVQPDLIRFLESSGYVTEHVSSGYSNHSSPDQAMGKLDIVYVRDDTEKRLFETVSFHLGPEGRMIPVPRVEYLAAMKIFAIKNNPRRVSQEMDDIQRILEIPGVDAEEIEKYFRQYGLEALLDRLD